MQGKVLERHPEGVLEAAAPPPYSPAFPIAAEPPHCLQVEESDIADDNTSRKSHSLHYNLLVKSIAIPR